MGVRGEMALAFTLPRCGSSGADQARRPLTASAVSPVLEPQQPLRRSPLHTGVAHSAAAPTLAGGASTAAASVALASLLARRRSRRANGALAPVSRRKATVTESGKGVATESSSDSGGRRDRLVRYLGGEDGTISVRAVVATELVRDMCQKHDCSPIVSIALGRAVMGAMLLANGRDEGERVQLRVEGTGAVGSILGESSWDMGVRGMVGHPDAEASSIPELLGVGLESESQEGEGSEDGATPSKVPTLHITRTHPYWKAPYTGTTPLESGEIAEDIVQYLAMSEEIPSTMGLNVQWDTENNCVKHAEGWLVTLLPGWDETAVAVLETNVANFQRVELPQDKPREEAICEHLLRELCGDFQIEEQPRLECTCSKDRLLQAVMMLGKTEVLRILRDKEPLEGKCEWCGTVRTLEPPEVREYMKSRGGEEVLRTRASSPRNLLFDELQEVPEKGTADWT